MKLTGEEPTGKMFLQFKNQGINISNIIETTESQQEKGTQ